MAKKPVTAEEALEYLSKIEVVIDERPTWTKTIGELYKDELALIKAVLQHRDRLLKSINDNISACVSTMIVFDPMKGTSLRQSLQMEATRDKAEGTKNVLEAILKEANNG